MLTLDTREFVSAVRFQMAVTPRTCQDILNRAGGTAIVGSGTVKGAMQRTPKASIPKIRALPLKVIAAAVAKRLRKQGRLAGMSKAEFAKEVTKERNRRISSKAYTAGPGWHKAAVGMGKRGVRTQGGFERSEARKGRGRKATAMNLVAEIVNTAPASEEIGFHPLQDGLDDTALDMTAYGMKKVQEQFDKSNG